jgi:N-methylhydantoinase B/oxoprolinase/acetone carboxylase alpha subunit
LRDPERVRQDVIEGLVDLESARDDYGVVIRDRETFNIDWAATQAIRNRSKTKEDR